MRRPASQRAFFNGRASRRCSNIFDNGDDNNNDSNDDDDDDDAVSSGHYTLCYYRDRGSGTKASPKHIDDAAAVPDNNGTLTRNSVVSEHFSENIFKALSSPTKY